MKDEIKVEVIYGYACARPSWHAQIIEPPPLKWWEVIYYGALSLWHNVIVPALLFALSWTCFLYSIKFAFA